MKTTARPGGRTRLNVIIAAGNKLAGAAAIALTLVLSAQGCQTSWTPKPTCPSGQHAERAPSHQGHVWQCVQNGPSHILSAIATAPAHGGGTPWAAIGVVVFLVAVGGVLADIWRRRGK